MKHRIISLFCLLLLSITNLSFADNQDSYTLANLYNKRYCEIATIVKGDEINDFFNLYVSVYNTEGLNDCPQTLWEKLTVDEIKKTLKVKKAILNGPRYLLMNSIQTDSKSAKKADIDVGGITMKKGAEVKLYIWQAMAGEKPYKAKKIVRKKSTTFLYNTNTEVYQLVNPDGEVYVMQSYSQQVDPHLSVVDLKTLEKRLKLPKGWKYVVQTLDQPLTVSTHDKNAYVLSDELHNMYQKIVK